MNLLGPLLTSVRFHGIPRFFSPLWEKGKRTSVTLKLKVPLVPTMVCTNVSRNVPGSGVWFWVVIIILLVLLIGERSRYAARSSWWIFLRATKQNHNSYCQNPYYYSPKTPNKRDISKSAGVSKPGGAL